MGFFEQLRDKYAEQKADDERRAKEKLVKAKTKSEQDKILYDLQMAKIERKRKLDNAVAKGKEAELRRKKAEGKLGEYGFMGRFVRGMEKATGNSKPKRCVPAQRKKIIRKRK